jgi:hypothetical protein
MISKGAGKQMQSKKCPYCSKEIPLAAFICKYCGKLLSEQAAETKSRDLQYSNAQAPWRLFLLYVLSFGLYHFYWFYRNWKHLKIQHNLKIRPGWRTLVLFIPIVDIILMSTQFRDIRDFLKKAGLASYSVLTLGLITFGYISFKYISLFVFLYERAFFESTYPRTTIFDLIQFILYVSAAFLLVKVQISLNKYWKSLQPELEMRTDFSTREAIVILIGVIFWLLTIVGLFIPEEYIRKLQQFE